MSERPASEPAGGADDPQATEPIQTAVRLDPEMRAALRDLATRKRRKGGQRVSVKDLLIEGACHVLAVNEGTQIRAYGR